ncbi:hypothetical protein ACS0TY_006525 [Phlomoides rotata]
MELDDLLKQEEIWWFQRSRALWLKDGDRNSAFFHAKASQRKRRNTVQRIKDDRGYWVTGDEGIGRVMGDFFQQLYSSVSPRNMHRAEKGTVKDIIQTYEDASGQRINMEKSEFTTTWRVGDGTTIRCFEDRWMGARKLERPRSGHEEVGINWVSDLIDPVLGTWKQDLIMQTFSPEDTNQILATPLSDRRPRDKKIWSPSTTGKFTVKSAYYLAINMYSKHGRGLPSSSTNDTAWKSLWQCKVPPKIIHFLWRINPRQKKSRDAQNPQYLKWQPPPLGGLKLNTDAASFSDGTVGCGFVLRTNSGNVVLAGSKWMKGAGNSTLLEALALRFANGQELWYPMLSRGDGLSEPGLGPSKGV